MNTFTEIAGSDDAQFVFDAVVAPLSPGAPCGASARHEPVFTEIRLLREEDDPRLPMRQWERQLKRADWAGIERLCIDMLTTRSKDLQIVVWLIECWTRQRGLAGLGHGLQLLDVLLRLYWPSLHPLIEEDGDCDARLAPLEWLNESLSASVRVHVALLRLGGDQPQPVTLADWERVAAPGDAAGATVAGGAPTRADLVAAARAGADLAATRAAAGHALKSLRCVSAFLAERLGAAAPNLEKLQQVLEAVQRVLMQWAPAERAGAGPAGHAELDARAGDGSDAAGSGLADPSRGPDDDVAAPPAPPVIAGWRDRGEAYATLEALAEYLSGLEPHSPAPFLIHRAVRWSRMPLPEVLAEIIREEGDLNRLVKVLGITL